MMQYQRKSVLLASALENFITPITKERHIETWTRTNCWLAADAQEVLYTGFVHNTKLQFDAILSSAMPIFTFTGKQHRFQS